MKQVIAILFAVNCMHAHCQTLEDVSKLYNNRNLSGAYSMAVQLIKSDTSAQLCGLLGRIYVDEGKYDSCLYFLQRAIKLDADETWTSGWSHAYLGKAYAELGEREKARVELDRAISINKTRNSVTYAEHQLAQYGLGKAGGRGRAEQPNWIKVESDHILFCFQDTINWTENMNTYIEAHERAYKKLAEIFHPALPRKLLLYVWTDKTLAEKLLHQPLGFTDPGKCICNVHRNQTVGHEMTHALSYWGWGEEPKARTRFVNEGVAVAFDLDDADKTERAKAAVAGKNLHSILEIWEDEAADANLLYPVAGAFFQYLYRLSTPEQFKRWMKNQDVADVKRTFGADEFAKIIADFNRQIGLL